MLAEYDFKIYYRPGKKNVKADSLTRRTQDMPNDEDDKRLQYRFQTMLPPEKIAPVNAAATATEHVRDTDLAPTLDSASSGDEPVRPIEEAFANAASADKHYQEVCTSVKGGWTHGATAHMHQMKIHPD